MKKMFTLLVCIGLATVSFAQYRDSRDDNEKRKDYGYHDGRADRDDKRFDEHRYYEAKREMERRIAEINRAYDRRINAVENDCFSSRFKKRRMIKELNERRRDDIRQVYERYSRGHNPFEGEGPKRHW
jgi:hypothetical protein